MIHTKLITIETEPLDHTTEVYQAVVDKLNLTLPSYRNLINVSICEIRTIPCRKDYSEDIDPEPFYTIIQYKGQLTAILVIDDDSKC